MIRYKIDPLNAFEDYNPKYVESLVGLVPNWLVNPEFKDCEAEYALKAQYGFPASDMSGKIENDLYVSKFSEDEKLFPVIRIERGKEFVLQYEYGIVAILKEDGTQKILRMD